MEDSLTRKLKRPPHLSKSLSQTGSSNNDPYRDFLSNTFKTSTQRGLESPSNVTNSTNGSDSYLADPSLSETQNLTSTKAPSSRDKMAQYFLSTTQTTHSDFQFKEKTKYAFDNFVKPPCSDKTHVKLDYTPRAERAAHHKNRSITKDSETKEGLSKGNRFSSKEVKDKLSQSFAQTASDHYKFDKLKKEPLESERAGIGRLQSMSHLAHSKEQLDEGFKINQDKPIVHRDSLPRGRVMRSQKSHQDAKSLEKQKTEEERKEKQSRNSFQETINHVPRCQHFSPVSYSGFNPTTTESFSSNSIQQPSSVESSPSSSPRSPQSPRGLGPLTSTYRMSYIKHPSDELKAVPNSFKKRHTFKGVDGHEEFKNSNGIKGSSEKMKRAESNLWMSTTHKSFGKT
eukprot:gb/GECH01014950.1/.p1 GENE.gb/GECH01014950.1/~~gb/GECH01014950.1/.p1  ORF type:complete len:399 (+),score=97.43 gb/GECH01014950.1/:1-1197(+)